MKHVAFVLAATVLLVLPVPDAPANPPPRPRVGVLFWHDSPNDRMAFEGVRAGFELAGRDPEFDIVRAEGDDARAREALARFDAVGGVSLIYAMGTAATLRARDVVRRAPVVFTAVTDPLGSGILEEPPDPKSRLCGNSSGIPAPDALAVFRRALPGLRVLGVLADPGNPVSRAEIAAMTSAAKEATPTVVLDVLHRPAASLAQPGEARDAATLLRDRCDALWIPIDIAVYERSTDIADAFASSGKPVFSTAVAASRTAASVSLATDLRSLGRASVVHAVAVLDGASPASLPPGHPRSFRVLVNLEAARRSGFEIPLSLVVAADEFVGVAGGR
jgi:putative ABC transport system substrate-binding protein